MNSIDEPIDPAARSAALQGAQVEIDTFCPSCGCNLFGRAVTIHERLRLPVCRCPGCNRFHPAAYTFTGSWPAVRRLNSLLLIGWSWLYIFILLVTLVYLAALPYAYISQVTSTVARARDGGELYWSNGGSNPGSFYRMRRKTGRVETVTDVVLTKEFHNPYYYTGLPPQIRPPPWQPFMSIVGVVLFSALLLGLFLPIASWHLKRKISFALLTPAVLAMIAYVVCMQLDPLNAHIRGWIILVMSTSAAVETALLAAALWAARPVARWTVRMFLPPVLRQYFAFLWFADDKKLKLS